MCADFWKILHSLYFETQHPLERNRFQRFPFQRMSTISSHIPFQKISTSFISLIPFQRISTIFISLFHSTGYLLFLSHLLVVAIATSDLRCQSRQKLLCLGFSPLRCRIHYHNVLLLFFFVIAFKVYHVFNFPFTSTFAYNTVNESVMGWGWIKHFV